MATRAIKHFRLRELARAPPPPPVLKPTTPSSFDFSKFDFSQPTQREPSTPTSNFTKRVNPFIPSKNSKTGRWAPPRYSLRQQAELIKKAHASNTLALLPPSQKTSAAHLAAITFAKAQPISKMAQVQAGTESRAENGSEKGWTQPIEWVGEVRECKVPGAEIGNRLYAGKKQMFKGHKWERVAEKRAIKRNMLMRDMAKRVQRYKQHHKRRKPNPLKSCKVSGGKLPF